MGILRRHLEAARQAVVGLDLVHAAINSAEQPSDAEFEELGFGREEYDLYREKIREMMHHWPGKVRPAMATFAARLPLDIKR